MLTALSLLLASACGGEPGGAGTTAETITSQPPPLPRMTRISTGTDGVQADGRSWTPAISGDGAFAAFESDATNLVPDDTNGVRDIFLKDLASGDIERVSTDSSGGQADGGSYAARLSADGRYVTFQSGAVNLAGPAGSANFTDIFRKDRLTGQTVLVSAGSDGAAADGPSELPSISDDGRFIVFRSQASNLAPGDENGTWDVFLADTATGAITLVSADSAGVQANSQSSYRYRPVISGDGRIAVFESDATNLAAGGAGDANSQPDIFHKDLGSGIVTLVSSTPSDAQALHGPSLFPGVSVDGRLVSFRSEADNLVAGDTNMTSDVFVKDMETGELILASADAAGVPSNNGAWDPAISGGGLFVVFSSNSTRLVPLSTGGAYNIYRKNIRSGAIELLSLSQAGEPGNDWCDAPSISADGKRSVFEAKATNLVPGDTNNEPDIFFVSLA